MFRLGRRGLAALFAVWEQNFRFCERNMRDKGRGDCDYDVHDLLIVNRYSIYDVNESQIIVRFTMRSQGEYASLAYKAVHNSEYMQGFLII